MVQMVPRWSRWCRSFAYLHIGANGSPRCCLSACVVWNNQISKTPAPPPSTFLGTPDFRTPLLGRLHTKLAVRAKPHELQYRVIRFPVDQHQVRLDVAIPMIFPFTA